MATETGQVYHFEGFALDSLRRVLKRADGTSVRVKPKALDTLLYLVRHRDEEVLTKSTLLKVLWGNRIVDENSLNQQIATLRRALGERAGDNRFIVTLPRRGYRFVAEVVETPCRDGGWSHLASASAESLPGDREYRLVQRIHAPRERVFDAWTRPEQLRQWYGLENWTLHEADIDLQVGGTWRIVTRAPDGRQVVQRGTYREVDPPARLVYTEGWPDAPYGELIVEVEFAAQSPARSTLTLTVLYPDGPTRDALIEAGLNRDVKRGIERLARFAAA